MFEYEVKEYAKRREQLAKEGYDFHVTSEGYTVKFNNEFVYGAGTIY